jgi:pantoate--beta-alanine ligase
VQVIETIAAFREFRATVRGTLGVVPTMGYLHEGHIELVRRAAAENDQVAVTIFVNPAQFGPNEDFFSYPRDTEHDLAVLREANVAAVFMPAVKEMYPDDFQSSVDVTGVSQGLEGGHRPGHFVGVATVVTKLFNITQPTRVYFGQKDAQQVAVVRQMVRDLNFPLQIVVVPTVRAPDGLALSSRNTYLTSEQRLVAPVLYRALMAAKSLYEKGERSPDALRGVIRDTLSTEPMTQVDYVSAADAQTLTELNAPSERPILLSMAVRIGKARLIDNAILGES